MQAQIDEFITRRALPEHYRDSIERHFQPLAGWLVNGRPEGHCAVLGINGAQGTGKSTLAALLRLLLASRAGWRVAVLSLDDFYLPREQRQALAANIHPLLQTRGVPGTHDVALLGRVLHGLRGLPARQSLRWPRFDKRRDDRADEAKWHCISGPLDLIILEGWCVGSLPQPAATLAEPLNELERECDPAATWRQFVNQRLQRDYRAVFSHLDKLLFLQAPDFAAIYRWRLEQERKLPGGPAVMDDAQLARFVLHYERLTRADLRQMPDTADVVLRLNRDHRCVASYYRQRAEQSQSLTECGDETIR